LSFSVPRWSECGSSHSERGASATQHNPGTALDRSGHPNPVPRVTGKIRHQHAVEVRDVQFLCVNTDRTIKITVSGPATRHCLRQDAGHSRRRQNRAQGACRLSRWTLPRK